MVQPSPHSSNFDGVRLGAALLVIFGHEFSIRGLAQPEIFGSHIASLGVKIFFSVSGYLVAQSFARDPDAWRFLQRRALRIVPGLVFCVLVTVFVLGPLVTQGSLANYARDPGTLAYVWNLAFGFAETMPALFADNPLPHAVNGSLWSLPAEAAMYCILLATALASGGSLRRWTLMTLAVFAASLGVVYGFGLNGWTEVLVYGTRLSAFCVVAGFFCAGSLAWLLRASVPLRFDIAAALVLSGLVLRQTLLFPLLEPLAVTYVALTLCLRSTPGLRDAARFGDFSYGLYLFAYPLQQTVQQAYGDTLDFGPAFALSLAGTIACAAVSWHAIEKRCMRFKPAARPSAASAPPAGGHLYPALPSQPAGPVKSAAAH